MGYRSNETGTSSMWGMGRMEHGRLQRGLPFGKYMGSSLRVTGRMDQFVLQCVLPEE